MANLTFTIPDADLPDYISAFSANYQANIQDPNQIVGQLIPNPLTKNQFAKAQAAALLARVVADYRNAVAQKAINVVTPIIT